ncbi:CPBP family intramembrane glutamic endopeptidase [Streptomyces roseoverticillatus]|uniref:CPBP family intramembrane glutamic endopeptidase n=1 Tax=Streptomyces roseoverticillatus TaxID=66429 RepID=A0ABV3IMI9_9ACTN
MPGAQSTSAGFGTPPPPPPGWAVHHGDPRHDGPSSAPPGSRYHQQARNGRQGALGRIGEFLLMLLLAAAGPVLAVVVVMVAGYAAGLKSAGDDGDRVFTDPLADQAAGLAALAVGIPVVLLVVRWCCRRPAGTVSSVRGRLRWGWLGRCAAVAFPLLALQLGLLIAWEWVAEGTGSDGFAFPGWPSFLLAVTVIGVLVPFQAAAEEYVFRGWVTQFCGGFLRSPWPGVVVGSLLFALAHGLGQVSGFALLVYSAMWWGWLVIRTGGLEAVIAVHAANNVLTFWLAAAAGQLSDTSTAADAPWPALVLEAVFAPAYCLIVARLAKRHRIEDRSSPTAIEARPAGAMAPGHERP